MSQENIERLKRESSAMNWVVGLVAALVVYVVSPMPVMKLFGINGSSIMGPRSRVVEVIIHMYAPLDWAYNHNKLVKQFYDWEAHLIGLR